MGGSFTVVGLIEELGLDTALRWLGGEDVLRVIPGREANPLTAEELKSPRLFSEITPALERRTRLGEEVRCYSSLTNGTLEVRNCRLFSEWLALASARGPGPHCAV